MKNGKLQAAVIGLGMGARHAAAYLNNPEYELVAICDPDAKVIEKQRKLFNIPESVPAYGDYRDVVNLNGVDVVSIASPDYYHAEQSIACLESGKNVLCEKPLTLDLAECEAIIAAAKRTGKVFMTAHPTRYTPAFMLARKLIRRGDIGTLYMVESEYAHNYRRVGGNNNWRKDPRRDPLLGGGCHAVDLIRWIVGEPMDEAFAYSNKFGLPDWPIAADNYMCLYKFSNGVVGKVMCSIGVSRPYTMRSVFYGTKGTIICDNTSPTMQMSSVPFYDTEADFTQFVTIPVEIANHNVELQISCMADSILRGGENKADACEGASTVAACCAAIESAATGKPVKVKHY